MQDGELLVIIIDTPNSNRSQPLVRSLGADPRFDVVRLPACMLNTYQDMRDQNIDVAFETFQFIERRLISPQEIGCATSHNRARHLLANSLSGGVILEDDARITNVDLFYETALNFLEKQSGKSSVLSMNNFRVSKELAINKEGSQRLIGAPFLAVSYVATPSAARALYRANEPIKTVSDWPRTNIKYYSLFMPLVVHGDNDGLSTIDLDGQLNRKGLKLSAKITHLSFISFFISKPKTLSFLSFIDEIYWSRISWNLDTLVRRLIKGLHR
jgi:GR25 family glycosyltransferase involved in LPS biosynthesis